MEVDMHGYGRRYGWAVALVVVLLSAVVGIVAYNVGLSHGIAESALASGDGVPPYAWGWHRPWGFGFGFPLLFLFFWIFVMKALFWGWGGPWRHRYYAGWHGGPPSFDEWHRRAHERMKENPPADPS
jgi:hypothetical protein